MNGYRPVQDDDLLPMLMDAMTVRSWQSPGMDPYPMDVYPQQYVPQQYSPTQWEIPGGVMGIIILVALAAWAFSLVRKAFRGEEVQFPL